MVTKQQQLEWLAKECHTWNGSGFMLASEASIGYTIPVLTGWHIINRQEWQQERDKMQKQAEQPVQPAQPAQPALDNSWHERGELPPVGCECSAVRNGEWVTVEILRHRVNNAGMNVAAVMSCASFNVFWATDFRPLRAEREKAIDEMAEALINRGSAMSRVILSELYDAGFRMEKPQ